MLRTVILLVLAVGATACNRSAPPSAPSESPVSTSLAEHKVEQVLSNPQADAHRLVTIQGCYFHGFEDSTLRACQGGRLSEEAIWVEDATMIHDLDQWQPKGNDPDLSWLRIPLLFQYDEARNTAAWRELRKSWAGSQVTVVGQFETTVIQVPGVPRRDGFGHLGQFKHELILVDVVPSNRQLRMRRPSN
jgi:hypothetical protein